MNRYKNRWVRPRISGKVVQEESRPGHLRGKVIMKTIRYSCIQAVLLLSLCTGAYGGTLSLPMLFGTPVIDPTSVEEPLLIPGTSDLLRQENWPAIP